jgi:hypothetical protein
MPQKRRIERSVHPWGADDEELGAGIFAPPPGSYPQRRDGTRAAIVRTLYDVEEHSGGT